VGVGFAGVAVNGAAIGVGVGAAGRVGMIRPSTAGSHWSVTGTAGGAGAMVAAPTLKPAPNAETIRIKTNTVPANSLTKLADRFCSFIFHHHQ
jgi:hypothetical protein